MSNRSRTAQLVAVVAAIMLSAVAQSTGTRGTQTSELPQDGVRGRREALLTRARLALGGGTALARVRALVVTREDRLTEKMVFPDRFQTSVETPWGVTLVTLDGEKQWSRIPPLPSIGVRPGAAATTVDLARSAKRKLALYGLKYLLRVPVGPGIEVRHAGQVTYGPISGEALEFSGGDGFWALMLFDATSGLPLGQVYRIGGSPEVHGTHLIEQFSDYRPAGEILAPLKIAEYRVRLGKTEALAVWRFKVEVNPPLKISDFREPPADPKKH
jgi:hypothetical protein